MSGIRMARGGGLKGCCDVILNLKMMLSMRISPEAYFDMVSDRRSMSA